MRLLGGDADYKDRTHFVAIAALKMRSVLVDHLRARGADKRGGNAEQLTLSHADQVPDEAGIGLANRKPCPVSQSACRNKSRLADVSTPSATTSMPSPCAS